MRMTGGEALAKQLQREGVRVVFGLPGVQLYGAMAALRDEKDIRFIADPPRAGHELHGRRLRARGRRRRRGAGGAGARAAQRRRRTQHGVLRSSPVFLMVRAGAPAHLGKDVGVLHEINEQLDVIKPVTKWRKRVLESRRDPGGRPRGVPPAQDRPAATGAPRDPARHAGGRGRGRAVAGGHGGAHRGARRRHRAGRARAARRHAPGHLRRRRRARFRRPRGAGRGGRISTGRRGAVRRGQGRGERRERSRRSARRSGPRARCATTSTPPTSILVVGIAAAPSPASSPTQKIVQIDADRRGDRPQPPDDRSASPATPAPRSSACWSACAPTRPAALAQARARGSCARRSPRSTTQEPNHSILASLRAGTPEDAIVIAGMTQIGYYSRPFWPVYQPRTYITSSYSGNLGYESRRRSAPRSADPTAPVICIVGDGGFLYNSQELVDGRPAARSTWWSCSSTTTPTATWPATSTRPGAAPTAPRYQPRLHEARRGLRRRRPARQGADRRRRPRPRRVPRWTGRC